MKMFRAGAVIGIVALVFTGCMDPFFEDGLTLGSQQSEDKDLGDVSLPGSDPSTFSPNDVVNDVARSVASAQFETFVAIDLDIDVALFSRSSEPQPTERYDVFLTVTDAAGDEIVRRRVLRDGTVDATFAIATKTDEIQLRFDGPAIAPRTIVVDDPAAIQSITRSIELEVASTGASAVMAAVALEENDSDGDGVPDDIDAFPDDPTQAFTSVYPVTGELTVGFEDNFPVVGDGDYNDFLATYSITEVTDGDNNIVQIIGSFTARARAALFDHEFGVVINFDGAVADLFVQQRDSEGNRVRREETRETDSARIIVFDYTKEAFDRPGGVKPDNAYPDQQDSAGHRTLFILTFVPEESDPGYEIDAPPYDPYLYIHDTTYDVHLIGRPSLDVTENPDGSDGFIDDAGYPRGLLVPAEWAHPIEITPIETAYPRFDAWRADLAAGILTGPHNNWYEDPDPDHVVPVP
jgi:LruC domain-containing protein